MQFDMMIASRAYFMNNWISTPLQVPEADFDNDNFPEYIRLAYIVNGSEMVGLNCTEEHYGYVQIHCYHKNEILSVKLADNVKSFFGNTLALDPIKVNEGTVYSSVKVDNGYYDTVVQFKIEKI